jgi:hypothetical protein
MIFDHVGRVALTSNLSEVEDMIGQTCSRLHPPCPRGQPTMGGDKVEPKTVT